MRTRAAGSDLVWSDVPPDPVASNPSGTLESAAEVGRGPTVTVGSNEEPPLKPTCRLVTKARRRASPRALSGLRPVETVKIDLVARLYLAEINRRRLVPIDPAPRLACIDFLCRLTC